MVNVSRTFIAAVPRELAVAYLADFGNAEEWDPGTVSCTRIGDGPVERGARWRNVSKILGRETGLDYELTEKRRDGVTFEGRNDTATSTDRIDVHSIPEGARITYRARIRFHGLARLADPLMRLVFERLAGKTVDQMTRALERHAQQGG
jgi:carbon monoxide dehydrogenase subunit G